MKKIYESPVVELTGFSVEDVITTSNIDTLGADFDVDAFKAAVGNTYGEVNKYGDATYTW